MFLLVFGRIFFNYFEGSIIGVFVALFFFFFSALG